LPKITENHAILRKIDKTHLKDTKNGAKDVCEGLFRGSGEKSVKKVAKVPFIPSNKN
jgi:hypothetical protein